MRSGNHKQRRSFTLSKESISFLERERRQARIASVSAFLDQLIQQCRRQKEQQRIEASITRYYDSLSPEEVDEEKDWAEFVQSQIPETWGE